MMSEPAYPLFEKRRRIRRGPLEMRVDIMRTLRYEPKRLLRISMETNLCYQPLRTNLEFMAEKGLVGMSKVPPRTSKARKYGVVVFLTRKGLLVLNRLEAAYGELLDMKSHEEDLIRDMTQEQSMERAAPL